MALLTKQEIFDADDRETREVEVPEWGGEVLVRSLSGKERDEFEVAIANVKSKKGEQNLENVRARLVSMCIVDERGTRLFSDRDITTLGNKSVKALQRVYNVCQEMNALSDEDVEELTEDFEETPEESSPSD